MSPSGAHSEGAHARRGEELVLRDVVPHAEGHLPLQADRGPQPGEAEGDRQQGAGVRGAQGESPTRPGDEVLRADRHIFGAVQHRVDGDRRKQPTPTSHQEGVRPQGPTDPLRVRTTRRREGDIRGVTRSTSRSWTRRC